MANICITLIIRYPFDFGDEEFYHWMFWLPVGDSESGRCLHVTNESKSLYYLDSRRFILFLGPGGEWEFEERSLRENGSKRAAAVGKIGYCNDIDRFVAILESIPMVTPPEDINTYFWSDKSFDCRVWIRQALRLLIRENIIKCDNIAELEKELLHHAAQNRSKVEKGDRSGIHFTSRIFV